MPLRSSAPVVTPLRSLYEQLAQAKEDLSQHKGRYSNVYNMEAELREAVEVLETKVKQALHQQFRGKQGIFTDYNERGLRVTVTAGNGRKVDSVGLLSAIPSLLKQPGLVSINLKALDALIAEIDAKPDPTTLDRVIKSAVERLTLLEPRTPAVEIKSVGTEDSDGTR